MIPFDYIHTDDRYNNYFIININAKIREHVLLTTFNENPKMVETLL